MYQTDYQERRKTWLVDPLTEVINWCQQRKNLKIADFGCGTAELAEKLSGKHKVHSFDHIAINDAVVACDVAAGVPLDDEDIDVAVFCLSLMGSNWRDYLAEAWRCLKTTGQLIIWNPTEQTATAMLPMALQRAGFKLIEQEERYKWTHCWANKIPRSVKLVEATEMNIVG